MFHCQRISIISPNKIPKTNQKFFQTLSLNNQSQKKGRVAGREGETSFKRGERSSEERVKHVDSSTNSTFQP